MFSNEIMLHPNKVAIILLLCPTFLYCIAAEFFILFLAKGQTGPSNTFVMDVTVIEKNNAAMSCMPTFNIQKIIWFEINIFLETNKYLFQVMSILFPQYMT